MAVDIQFEAERKESIEALGKQGELRELSLEWMAKVSIHKYCYNFNWLGRPIIQFPPDIIAMQELIWEIKPDLIFETGIARGGSLIFYASMLELIGGDGFVLGVDVDIRAHNREEIEAHPMFKRIRMIEGSAIAPEVVKQVHEAARGKERVLVVLDSNHCHDHVLKELEAYSPLVAPGSYVVVFDTVVEELPPEICANRPWGIGSNPRTAVWEFLKTNDRFIVDREIEHKLLITVAPDGYLKCVK